MNTFMRQRVSERIVIPLILYQTTKLKNVDTLTSTDAFIRMCVCRLFSVMCHFLANELDSGEGACRMLTTEVNIQ